ncbi:hypothetical protein G8E10_09385 [Rhizobiaceae bacterium CRRU44]|uniref:Uncharacterized protein n=1 Tax=Ferranicluibacter rubi TaxID=2715133 RepID=A0AA44CC17_9HYPH|nr:hypothetical protein [Ferranicluibacter rubi]NHT75891.1 hypothetical protein [Ferranicluibacter rubi]NHT75951.1 hypothetical protein [Ferranicluibacter rubi]
MKAEPEADEIDRIAHRVHVERSDDFTLKWSKQTSKHRNSARGSVRTLIAAMKALGYAPLTKRRALSALKAENAALLSRVERLTKDAEVWRMNSRDTFDAMCAMRNAINEHIPMPSFESDLLQGPETSVFCSVVAQSVIVALQEKSHD